MLLRGPLVAFRVSPRVRHVSNVTNDGAANQETSVNVHEHILTRPVKKTKPKLDLAARESLRSQTKVKETFTFSWRYTSSSLCVPSTFEPAR